MTEDERLGSLVTNYGYYFGSRAKIIFDCGTRDGDDAAYLQHALNAEQVYAIDASPSAIELTRSKHPKITAIHTALSNYEGEAQFSEVVSDRKDLVGSSSFVLPHFLKSHESRTITTPVTTMDNLLEKLGLASSLIDVVKVDIEGFTYEFLQGYSKYLHNAKVLHLETETYERHEGHKNNKEVYSLLISKGFSLEEVSYEWGPSIEDQIWVNRTVE
jgi:FkbM family methyltransferase